MRAMTGTGPARAGRRHRRAWTAFVATVVLATTAGASALLAAGGAAATGDPGTLGSLAGSDGVSVGHSGWFWGNPQPQGNALHGIDFAGSRGYAAGDFGTLLRTDDGGDTWEGLPTGITARLVTVRVVDSNTVVIGGDCALRRSDDGGKTFTRLPWTGSDQNCPSSIASFSFPSASIGYLMTQDGSILRTNDGGATFARKTSVPGTDSAGGARTPTDIFFTGDNSGVVTTSGDGPGKVFRTNDGGNSWTEVASAPNGPQGAINGLNGLDFAGGAGYAVGSGKTLLKSVDSGASWTPKPLDGVSGLPGLESIGCAGADTCLMTESGGGQLVRTTDSGDHGTAVSPSTEKIFAAGFASSTRAVAVGNSGATVVSDNAGASWAPVGGAISGSDFSGLRATSSQLAEAGGDNGTVARTIDGGANWFTVGVPTPASIRDVSFPSQGTGFALDTAGGVFKTINGGTTWSILDTGASGNPRALLAVDANHVLLIGPKGLRLSTDGGNSFKTVKSKAVKGKSVDDVDVAGSALVAFGQKTLALSKDNGKTWKKLKRPKDQELFDVDFVGASKGYALAQTGALYKTSNGGDKWKVVKGSGTNDGSGISFSSAKSGYMSLYDFGNQDFGYVLRTKNGGKTWQPQLIAPERVEVSDAQATGYALMPFSAGFFATTTGGQAGDPSQLTLDVPKGKASKGKKKKVKVVGKLSPPEGGEQIVLASRKASDPSWNQDTLTAATNGKFTAKFKVKKKKVFVVAQWSGDDERAGAGSKVLVLKPKKKH
jgi:photosystem II stability/assembly factor-like uncharacterized protein